MDGSESTDLNLKQVAHHLGVHYMTAYRYVRTGRLPARRVGSGWVVSSTDLTAFERLGLGASEATPDPPSGRPGAGRPSADGTDLRRVDWVERMRQRLIVGDEAGAWAVAEAALIAGWEPEAVLVDLVAEAVARTDIGDGPAAGHLAATTAGRVLALVSARFRRRGRSRGVVVVGAPEGEVHTLGLAVITDVLRLRNISVLELGSGVPSEAFAEAASVDRLVAVGIGLSSVRGVEGASAVARAVRAAVGPVPILVGGRAVANVDVARAIGATAWAGDARSMADVVEAHLPVSSQRRMPDQTGHERPQTSPEPYFAPNGATFEAAMPCSP